MEYETRKQTELYAYLNHKRNALFAVAERGPIIPKAPADTLDVLGRIGTVVDDMVVDWKEGNIQAAVFTTPRGMIYAQYQDVEKNIVVRIASKSSTCYIYQLQHADGSCEEVMIDRHTRICRCIPRRMPVEKMNVNREPGFIETVTRAAERVKETFATVKQIITGRSPQAA